MILRSISVGVEVPLVFQRVQPLAAGLGIDLLDAVALPQEDAVHPDLGADLHDVVVHAGSRRRTAWSVAVGEDQVGEVGHRVRRRGRGQADLDGVEVVEGLAPDRQLLRGVAAVALVRDDQVEGVDGDVEAVGVVLDRPLRFRCRRWPVGRGCSPPCAGSWRHRRRRGRAAGRSGSPGAGCSGRSGPLRRSPPSGTWRSTARTIFVNLRFGSTSKALKARTACAARARRSTRKRTRLATPAFIRR